VGEKGHQQAVLPLSAEAAWRIPERCVTDKLTMARHMVVRHRIPSILQKHARCSVDSNTNNALVSLFRLNLEVLGSNPRPPTFFVSQNTFYKI
jgi:hypothetical protein